MLLAVVRFCEREYSISQNPCPVKHSVTKFALRIISISASWGILGNDIWWYWQEVCNFFSKLASHNNLIYLSYVSPIVHLPLMLSHLLRSIGNGGGGFHS